MNDIDEETTKNEIDTKPNILLLLALLLHIVLKQKHSFIIKQILTILKFAEPFCWRQSKCTTQLTKSC
jgi:hypothetical protein